MSRFVHTISKEELPVSIMTLRQYCVRQRVSHSRALLPMGEARGRLPGMAATIAAIYRYPVKGLSAERMDRVALLPGECLPHDRRFAIALSSTLFDPQRPEWLSKINFIMLMRDEK